MIINDFKIISKSDLCPNQYGYTNVELESEFVKIFKIKDAIFLHNRRVTFPDYKHSVYATPDGKYIIYKHEDIVFNSKTNTPNFHPQDFIDADKALSDPEIPKELKRIILFNLDRFV